MYNQNKLYKNQYDSRWWCQPSGMIHYFWGQQVKRLKNNKIIKLFFQLVFSTYLPKVLLKLWAGVFVGCKI